MICGVVVILMTSQEQMKKNIKINNDNGRQLVPYDKESVNVDIPYKAFNLDTVLGTIKNLQQNLKARIPQTLKASSMKQHRFWAQSGKELF